MINKNNYCYSIEEDNKIYFSFYPKNNKKNIIGEMTLISCGDNTYETHSYISDPKYMGIGFGVFMYSVVIDWCIKKGYKIVSSELDKQSNDALRLWKSKRLNNQFKIISNKNRWVIQCGAIE